jgi:serine/threonine protein kinase
MPLTTFSFSRLKHPHILQLVGVTIRPLCFVMELATCDTLTHFLSAKGNAKKISWKEKATLAQDAAKGLLYLHTLDPPIIHRDIKGPNVLVMPQTRRRGRKRRRRELYFLRNHLLSVLFSFVRIPKASASSQSSQTLALVSTVTRPLEESLTIPLGLLPR